MKTRRALTLICGLLAPLAAVAATPKADLGPGATPAEVSVGNAKERQYRVAPGSVLTLTVTGPAKVRFAIRAEGVSKATATVELDGVVAAQQGMLAALQAGATSDKGVSLTEAALLAVPVPGGEHTVGLRWPSTATTDALVAIAGVRLGKQAAQVAAGLSLPGADLPLPGAPQLLALPDLGAPSAGKTPPPLPLPAPEAAAPKPLPAPAAQKPPEAVAAEAPSKAAQLPAAPPAPAAEPARSQRPAASGDRIASPAVALRAEPGWGPGPGLWTVTIFGGAERSSQQFTDAATLARAGLEATRTLWVTGLAIAQLDWRMSRESYVNGHPGTPNDITAVDEQRYDALIGIGYDFGHVLNMPRLTAAPIIGLKYMRLSNSSFPADLFGVDLMARLRYSLSDALAVHATFGWIYNLVHPSFFSALGSPLGQFGIRAGFDFPLSGGYALALDYQGDILVFDYSNRVAHGASAGFSRSF